MFELNDTNEVKSSSQRHQKIEQKETDKMNYKPEMDG